jgi:hypothetical protein
MNNSATLKLADLAEEILERTGGVKNGEKAIIGND